ncbi:MAG: restriction endonuclease, SacI family [Burkholderiales bacterium]|jgi:hypothetical protein|nr:restriction endonuclease, SacI family [Burkholderiales bacterium]
MAAAKRDADATLTELARLALTEHWMAVVAAAEAAVERDYLDRLDLIAAIRDSINHKQVGYRFALLVQLCGKVANPRLDALCLQRGKDGKESNWDASSLASKVVAPFNREQENVLGTSGDPYVGNAMRIPRMRRDDASKKDVVGWNVLVDVLEEVQRRSDPDFTVAVFRQVLLEFFRRQRELRFAYAVPPRVSSAGAIAVAERFLAERSGGDRALAIAGALFDTIGERFGLYVQVKRARINASDEASGMAADLECVDAAGRVLLAVEVKDRALTLADVEGTITKARHRAITEVLFAVPRTTSAELAAVEQRFATAYAGGQSLYLIDTLDLARAVFALVGDEGRRRFLERVGEHLNTWNTQPGHRQAWKKLLEAL